MMLKKKVYETIELTQKIRFYNSFDESTMNHFNIYLREIKAFTFKNNLSSTIKMEIDKLTIYHPELIDQKIGQVGLIDRLTVNKFAGPMFSFQLIWSTKDIQKKMYVLKNYYQLERINRMLK